MHFLKDAMLGFSHFAGEITAAAWSDDIVPYTLEDEQLGELHIHCSFNKVESKYKLLVKFLVINWWFENMETCVYLLIHF